MARKLSPLSILRILGDKATEAEVLALTGERVGDCWLVDGEGYIWTESEDWVNVGPLQGPPGAPGLDGDDGAPGATGPEGPQGPAGESGVTVDDIGLTTGEMIVGTGSGPDVITAPANYWSSLRNVGGIPTWGRHREAYLSDRDSVPTDATDAASIIQTYLDEYATQNVNRVYLTMQHSIGSTVDVPAQITLEGAPNANQYESTNKGGTGFKPLVNDMTMLRLTGRGSNLENVLINGANRTGIIGVRPNASFQFIRRCGFWLGANGGANVAIKGGGLLYLTIEDCAMSQFNRGVDILPSYADDPGAVYYGVNIGQVRNCIFGGANSVRMNGIFTVAHCDFEGGGTGIAIEVDNTDFYSLCEIEDNYFEVSSSVDAITVGANARAKITNNKIYHSINGITLAGYSAGSTIIGNSGNTATNGRVTNFSITDTGSPRAIITDIDEATSTGAAAKSYNKNTGGAKAYLVPDSGHVFTGGGIRANVNLVDNETTSLNVGYGWIHELDYSSPTTVTPTGHKHGMIFGIRILNNANVTLPTASWRLLSGQDETPPVGTFKLFSVGYDQNVREIGSKPPVTATKTATFTADGNARTYLVDATSGSVTANLPSAATVANGTIYTISKTDSGANAVTVDPASSQTIGGTSTFVLSRQYDYVTAVSDGANWKILDTNRFAGAVEIDGSLDHDGTTIGFFGTTPQTQDAANADTSGAVLADLETEVNQIKATLRRYGLIAT